MSIILKNCNYNKVRLLNDFSRIVFYLNKHCERDAKKVGHVHCEALSKEVIADMETHIEKLRQAIEGLSKEGKFN